MRRTHALTLLALTLAVRAPAPCQTPEPAPYLQATPEAMQWWREARFGMFVHWGPVSLKGTEISWSRGGDQRPGRPGRGSIPMEEYDSLYKQFNPTKFSADEWVGIARAAGMKYLVFTSKHHDGFCEFDSKLTDYKVTNSPYGKDICAELARACHAAGLKLGWYYSPPDWHHPDYRSENHARYIEYLHGQLRELCSNYGQVDIIWFDGLGGKSTDWNSEPLFKLIRELQPSVIINNRGGLRGDYDTPEQTIGRYQVDRPWESCITLCRQWAWRPNDQLKSLQECIHTLVRCVGGDGNLLLNVGPMPTGEIEPRQVVRLKEIGQWLGQYGATIYGTRGGPFRSTSGYAATCRENRIYLHILKWDRNPLVLPGLERRIVSVSTLTGGKATVNQTAESVEVTVPTADRHPLDTIVVLDLDGPAFAAKTIPLRSASLARGRPATASNVFMARKEHGPDKALDDNPDTRWATDYGVTEAWLEVDLGEPRTIGEAFISEEYGRVREFELQVKEGDAWRAFARGREIGAELTLKFEPVTGRHFRLFIKKATDGPTIWEFQLLAPR